MNFFASNLRLNLEVYCSREREHGPSLSSVSSTTAQLRMHALVTARGSREPA